MLVIQGGALVGFVLFITVVLIGSENMVTQAISLGITRYRRFVASAMMRAPSTLYMSTITVDTPTPHDSSQLSGSQCDGIILTKALPTNVYIDSVIRKHANINVKKTKFFIPRTINSTITVDYIRSLIEKKITALADQPYSLTYLIPGVTKLPKKLTSNDDVTSIILQADKESPFLVFNVESAPGVYPPTPSTYLLNMPDPLDTPSYTLVSFYRFFSIENPTDFMNSLYELWRPFKTVGRVYVATEGINAQMAIPTNVLTNFKAACETLPVFKDLYLNSDHCMPMDVFENEKPFKALHIRVRHQILADGFDNDLDSDSKFAFDWHRSGREMAPLDWHAALDDPKAIVLDCRNSYESDVGLFKNAIPLNTTFFRESWDALDEILEGKEKDAPILTYCTGGIRCVKINAYIEQKLGFSNVNRLQGGIIRYTREIEELSQPDSKYELAHLERHVEESKFRGVNYVFDERMGARITEDVLTKCETCGAACDSFHNCENVDCHVRFIQCGRCRTSYSSCCSMYCKKEYDNYVVKLAAEKINAQNPANSVPKSRREGGQKNMMPRSAMLNQVDGSPEAKQSQVIDVNSFDRQDDELVTTTESDASTKTVYQDHASSIDGAIEAINSYCEKHSDGESELLGALRAETLSTYTERMSRMISGPLQGRLLSMLATVSRAHKVLELGTFTGYATLSFAEGIAANIKAGLVKEQEAKIYSCDHDEKSLAIARKYVDKSEWGHLIELQRVEAADLIAQVRDKSIKFDMVFIDADKKMYRTYLELLLGTGARPPLLAPNAFIVIDNTLWKGLVLEKDPELAAYAPNPANYGSAGRMRTLATSLHEFNTFVQSRTDLEVVLLPLRDGLTIIRYRGPK